MKLLGDDDAVRGASQAKPGKSQREAAVPASAASAVAEECRVPGSAPHGLIALHTIGLTRTSDMSECLAEKTLQYNYH